MHLYICWYIDTNHMWEMQTSQQICEVKIYSSLNFETFLFQKMLFYKCWKLNMITVTCWNKIQLQDQFTPIFRLWLITHGCDVVCPIVVAVVSWQRRSTDLCVHTWHRLGTHFLCWQVHLEDLLLHLSWIMALNANIFGASPTKNCTALIRQELLRPKLYDLYHVEQTCRAISGHRRCSVVGQHRVDE